MRLLDMEVTNFMSIRHVKVVLAMQGLMLVQGNNNDSSAYDSNGAGKSTIFEALAYVLFDQTIRDLSADEIVNEDIGKNTSVVLNCEDDSGVPYRIARYRKHTEHKNAVKIFKNGENITPKSVKDANKFIVDLFGLDFPTFTNSVFFGQGLAKMFSLATDAEKKEILERMLQIDIFAKCLDIAKQKRDALKADLATVNHSMSLQDSKLASINQNLARLEEMEAQHRVRVEGDLERLREALSGAIHDRDAFVCASTGGAEKLAELLEEYDVIGKRLGEFKEYESTLVEMRAEFSDASRQKKRLESEVETMKQEAEKIADGQGTNCPACGSPISDEAIEQSIRHVYSMIKDHNKKISELTQTIDEVNEDIEKVGKFLQKKAPLEEKRQSIQAQVSDIKAQQRREDDMKKRLTDRVAELEDAISGKEKELEKTYKPLIDEALADKDKVIEAMAALMNERSAIQGKMEKVEFWVKGFGNSGVKSFLLDSVTPFLNKRANEYLGKLAGNTVQIEFSTQTRLASGEVRDKFDVRILNTIGGGAYKKNSMGERRRIDLAIVLALQDLVMRRGNGKLNVLIYDEIFDNLDAIGCENAIQLLQEMSTRTETIFVITHNDVLKSYFDRQLTVTKSNGVTTIEKVG